MARNGVCAQERHTPYPIIFVHGLTGSDDSWDTSGEDIVDFLQYGVTPLKYGGVLKITLDRKRDENSLSNTIDEDVHLFTTNPIPADFYVINFNVHADGEIPAGCVGHILLSVPILTTDVVNVAVTDPEKFVVNDIVRIDNEIMQVTGKNGGILQLSRGKCGSEATWHLSPNEVLNLSNESNQASIAKQGVGLKQAIDAVKNANPGVKKVILVCHSMGGLAAREYIQSNYYANDVAKIVTIGTPHYGSNLSDLPVASLMGIDGMSDAVRDLRSSITYKIDPVGGLAGEGNWVSHNGIFLFGGPENIISGYYNKDVDGNGLETDIVSGLNDFSLNPFPANISKTWIVSDWGNFFDGVVLVKNQYIYSGDTIMTHTPHVQQLGNPSESRDIYALIRGLDEPDEPELAYEIGENSTNKGFITYGIYNNPIDVDLFKIDLKKAGLLKISLLASSFTGIKTVDLINDNNDQIVQTISDISKTIEYQVDVPGIYYIKIKGISTNNSFNYPYTLNTNFVAAAPASMSVSPTNLQYYDVVINTPKSKTITLTNNGTNSILITGISISDNTQFTAAPMPPFAVTPDLPQNVTVTFNPTSVGAKTATLEITTNSADIPTKTVTLSGNGTDHETQILVCSQTTSYNFGDTKLSNSKSKTFTIQNTGSNTLTISNLAIEGLNPDPYTIVSPTVVPFDIASGATKQITVKFLPLSLGTKTGSLAITNNSDNLSPKYSIVLTGNGTQNYYTATSTVLMELEYWFDNQYQTKKTVQVGQESISVLDTQIPTDGLATGLHSINIRYQDIKGNWSSVVSGFFHRLPLTTSGSPKITASEYWFDDNYSSKVSGTFAPDQKISVNSGFEVGSLVNGLHSYHVRYIDDAGQWSSIVSEFFQKIPLSASATRNITAYEYWIDEDYAGKVSSTVTPGQTILVNGGFITESLSTGLHSYHIRYKDDADEWSSVVSEFFQKLPTTTTGIRKITDWEYWFDDNFSSKVSSTVTPDQAISVNSSFIVDSLANGLHSYHVRYKDDAGQWSSIVSEFFQKIPLSSSTSRNITASEYWIDEDYLRKVSSSITPGQTISINGGFVADSISTGFHSYHVRFKDDADQWSSVVSEFFHKLPATTTGIRKITDWEYWFDDNYSTKVSAVVSPDQLISVNTGFKVDSLSTGLHSYHVRYRDDAGQWSSIVSEFFQKIPLSLSATRNITACEYWIDEDYTRKVSSAVTPGQTILINDGFVTDSISTGLHSYYVRFKDDADQWSSVVSEFFHKLPTTTTGTRKITNWEYWFDNNYSTKVTAAVSLDQLISVNTGFKVDSLSGGLHSYHVRYKDDAGQWSSIVSEFFQKIPMSTSANRNITACEYWIDEDYARKISSAVTPGQTILINSDFVADSISTGLHSYHVRFKDDAGQWSSVVSEFFQKLPEISDGMRKITAWEYWFDDDYTTKTTNAVTADQIVSVNTGFEVGALVNGLHSYHVRYKDNAGQWSSIISELFQKLGTTNGQANIITGYRYWFDRNDKDMITVNVENTQNPYILIRNLNTCNLSLGNHTVHIQFRDLRLGWSSATNNSLIKSVNTIPEITFTGATTFCQGDSITLVAPTADSYLWSNGATTPTIKVTESGNYTVQVNLENSCSLSSMPVSIVVNQFPDAAEAIIGASTVSNNQKDVIYSVSTILNADSYTWTLPNGATGISNTNSITVSYNNAPLGEIGDIKVMGSNNCGAGLESTLKITVDRITGINTENLIGEIRVYPIPVKDMLNVMISKPFIDNYKVELYNSIGVLIQSILKSNIETEFSLDLSNYPAGMYFIMLSNNGISYQKKVIKK